jgi:hypothetical protein
MKVPRESIADLDLFPIDVQAELRISRRDAKMQNEQIEDLVPIRLDIDWEKVKIRANSLPRGPGLQPASLQTNLETQHDHEGST